MGEVSFAKGLEGIVVADTKISFIDGLRGKLYYSGYSIIDLAKNSTFEEVTYLLLEGKLPNKGELSQFVSSLKENYQVPPELNYLLTTLPKTSHPMDDLRTAVSFLGCFDRQNSAYDKEKNKLTVRKLIAQFPAIIAALWRTKQGQPIIQPKQEYSIAQNFLYMLNGQESSDDNAKLFDILLILHAEHGFNASTFAARSIVSSMTDIYSAVSGALGSLKGPLHGGANQNVFRMARNIKSVDKVEGFIDEALARKERIPGYGHRIYKVEDPRATILRELATTVADTAEKREILEVTNRCVEMMQQKKQLYPNVDLYSPTCYFSLGIDVELYTCMFAMSRISGWCAHILEQLSDNKLIRPLGQYTGKLDINYTLSEER